ncbi:hypothetical protein K504DRAFT_289757 [Pleomassaria siparia CBS 279.74]|uniref:Uncharacterized protein n=1 Tax=Pleomassaria siparia CBS 279.74 TaxID=1314801 RepID=A0A6G1K7F5_9PLEO|nr:hypothetical protein K504DRAFT_289757 [Pleomassaria siparia CBS 279.74]
MYHMICQTRAALQMYSTQHLNINTVILAIIFAMKMAGGTITSHHHGSQVLSFSLAINRGVGRVTC